MVIILMAIDGYSISEYWWFLMVIILMGIGRYSIGECWWILVVFNGYYICAY